MDRNLLNFFCIGYLYIKLKIRYLCFIIYIYGKIDIFENIEY